MLVILPCAFRRVDLWPQNSSGPIWIKIANSPCWACCDPSPRVKLRHAVGKCVHPFSPKYSIGKYLTFHLEIVSQAYILPQTRRPFCVSLFQDVHSKLPLTPQACAETPRRFFFPLLVPLASLETVTSGMHALWLNREVRTPRPGNVPPERGEQV